VKYIYALLVFLPIAVLLHFLIPDLYLLIFITSAIALVPLAAVLGQATEELAVYTGPQVGGLLNATLGNAAELIISIVALRAGLVDLVKASITGSIIGNILIVMGASLLAGGIKNGIQRFDRSSMGAVASMMLLAVISISVPTIFSATIQRESGHEDVQLLSDGVAIAMIVVYVLYLLYSFFTSSNSHKSTSDSAESEHTASWSLPVSLGLLVSSTIGIVVMSEILVGVVEEVVLALGWTEIFLGVMIIPLVGNVAEHLVGVQVAVKNRMDLSLSISLGSSLQVALFVAPVLVLISLFFSKHMDLVFTRFEIVALIAAVLIGNLVVLDGESNWLEGAQLITAYVILGIAFYFLPV